MYVVAYDPLVSRGTEIAVGVDRKESLDGTARGQRRGQPPLSADAGDAQHDQRRRRCRRCASDAILINTARGAIVDTDALIDALRDGVIAGAGIDVLPVEPPQADDAHGARPIAAAPTRLVGDRLIVTPHAAWSSPESVADARRLAVETAMLYLREGKLRNLVNTPAREFSEAPPESTGTRPIRNTISSSSAPAPPAARSPTG